MTIDVEDVVWVVVAGTVVILYEFALGLAGHVTVTLERLVITTLEMAPTAAAGITNVTELTLPPVPAGTFETTVNRYEVPPIRPVNVSDVPPVV